MDQAVPASDPPAVVEALAEGHNAAGVTAKFRFPRAEAAVEPLADLQGILREESEEEILQLQLEVTFEIEVEVKVAIKVEKLRSLSVFEEVLEGF